MTTADRLEDIARTIVGDDTEEGRFLIRLADLLRRGENVR